MATEGKNEVLFLTRDHIYLYDGSAILNLEFPANLVHDLDVKDRDALYNLIIKFIQDNKLIPAQLFFVLSEGVCFSKDFATGSPLVAERLETETKEFVDAIPFSSVVSKTYKTLTTTRVVGSNQDLIDTVFDAFENKGFGISTLVPASVFPEYTTATDLTAVIAQGILAKKDIAVAASMVGERTVKEQTLATSQNAVPKNKMLPYLIGVFAVLIIGLIVLIVIRR
jgi:hypothetical protein